MQQIFLEAKAKIKQLKEESRTVTMRSPKLLIDYRRAVSRNNRVCHYATVDHRPPPYVATRSGDCADRKVAHAEKVLLRNSQKSREPAKAHKENMERQASERRRDKILTLKTQLVGMLHS